MKKLIYLMFAFGITGIIVFPNPRRTPCSYNILNNKSVICCTTSGNLSQLVGSNSILLNELNNSQLQSATLLNKAPKYFNQGWPLKDDVKQIELESSLSIPAPLCTGGGFSCGQDGTCKCEIMDTRDRNDCCKKYVTR